jgi:hypothetical protein
LSYTPTDVANESLIAIGSKVLIGDIEEGSREARVLINKYWTCLRQLLRGAHWDFARRLDAMTMLADATGNTPNVGNIVIKPWLYEYSYPTNCAKARFVPHNGVNPNVIAGNWAAPSIWGDGLVIDPPVIIPPGAFGAAGAPNPVPTGLPSQRHLRPAKFIISADTNYPPAPGQELWAVQGVGNMGRTVILTNVYMASLCYTEIVLEPQRWDDLFRAAMVSFLASEVALPLAPDLKTGMALRADQIKITKMKLDIARATNGNEGWANNDISVDWMRERRGEQWQDPWWGPRGERYDCGWDGVGLADGVY